MKCARCKNKACYTEGQDCTGISDEIEAQYTGEDLEISRNATYLEGTYYMQLTRVEETLVFAKRMGYLRIGIAFCIGFAKEAQILDEILSRYFQVSSVCCKCSSIPKENLDYVKIDDDRDESICNPIGQAMMLERDDTEMNIIVGLCVGHDMLFTKHSKAPVTTLIAKDRVLAHNPVGALYSGYYSSRLLDGRRPWSIAQEDEDL